MKSTAEIERKTGQWKREWFFCRPTRFDVSIFQTTSSTTPNQSYISAPETHGRFYNEADIIFPEQKHQARLYSTHRSPSLPFLGHGSNQRWFHMGCNRQRWPASVEPSASRKTAQRIFSAHLFAFGNQPDFQHLWVTFTTTSAGTSVQRTQLWLYNFWQLYCLISRCQRSRRQNKQFFFSLKSQHIAVRFHASEKNLCHAYRTTTGSVVDSADTLCFSIRY